MKLAALLLALSGCAADRASTPAPGLEAPAEAPPDSVADWSRHFEAEGAVGTVVLLDLETGRTTRHDPARAAERLSPASTSKLFNSLVFLDRGVVADVDSAWAWDGVERWASSWNRDHSLRTAIEASAVWLFQRAALEVGRDGYAEVFARQPYGNSALSDSLGLSWLDGTWRVSADEQVAFLEALLHDRLAFSAADQAAVREIVPVLAEAGGAVLKGKTGWFVWEGEPELGWLVGWVERPAAAPVVFAMNAASGPGAEFDVGPGRLRIVRAVLAEAGAFPDAPGERP